MSTSMGGNVNIAKRRPRIDYTDKDFDSLREAMLQLASELLPEWTDHSDNDPGVVLLELFAYMGDLLLYYQDRIANESFLDSAVERRSVINMLRLIGCELRPQLPASVDLLMLFKSDAEGTVDIDTNAEFRTSALAAGSATVSFRYVRQKLQNIQLGNLQLLEKSIEGKQYRFFKIPVVQVDEVISSESVGSSDGSGGQRFKLGRTPLIDDSLEIRVNGKLWERRETLFNSFTKDEHYVVRRDDADDAWVEFGDGTFGRIPEKGAGNITASYRVGGGIKGNVPPMTVFKSVSGFTDPGSALQRIINLEAAAGGMEHEDCARAALRGPQLFRSMSRSVTADDYEAYARAFGVAKVMARAPSWNTVELYVAPAGGGMPSDTLKEDLRLYFEDKRMLSTVLEIHDPAYVDVFIEGELDIESTYLEHSVIQSVEDAVNGLLAFDNVDFGHVLYVSKVYEVIEALDGVKGVVITWFDNVQPPADRQDSDNGCSLLRMSLNQIPRAKYRTGIKITKTLGGRRGR